MKNKNLRLVIFVFLIFLIFTVAAIRAHSYMQNSSRYIEVCLNGPVYVPPGTQFVTCNGIIRKVRGFSRTDTPPPSDCICPSCCGGTCWVLVECDTAPEVKEDKSEASSKTPSKNAKASSQGLCYLAIAC